LSLLQTLDHSHTIYVPELDETYHSRNGAIQEALHVYIQMGLMEAAQKKSSIQILEIGFGTGLNAWLTLLEAQSKNLQINYHAIEPFPLPETLINNLNYTQNASAEASAIFQQMHLANWEQAVQITPEFSLLKIKNTLEILSLPQNTTSFILMLLGLISNPCFGSLITSLNYICV
ncbi:MAG: hypothetical protein ACK44P_01815, partial [Bacteroidota bacterium]